MGGVFEAAAAVVLRGQTRHGGEGFFLGVGSLTDGAGDALQDLPGGTRQAGPIDRGRQRFSYDGGGSGSPEDPPTKEKSRGFIVLTLVGFEDFLAQANGLRRDLDHLVVTDEFESLFQIE